MTASACPDPITPRVRRWRAAVLLAGLIMPQVLLFSPSLAGRTLLLPLDLLAGPYLPRTPEYADVRRFDVVLSDEILLFEPERRFAAAELRAGRLPLWNPNIYLGAPFAVGDKYSPFNLCYYLFPRPETLAWMQLLKSLVAGVGAYVLFRRVPRVGFWPAALGAWCYPLIGFMTLWQGFPQSAVAAWLPWLLVATDGVIRRPLGGWGPALAVLTGVVLVTRVDVGAQALLVAGLYGVWCLGDTYGWRPSRRMAGPAAAAAAAVGLGVLLAAVYLLPLAEYSRTSDRLLRRGAGQEERPPGSLEELPRLVLPEVYGSTQTGSVLLRPGNLPESPAAAYAGLLATLVLAPLAWCSRRHRSVNGFWVFLSVVALAWALGLPGLVWLLRAPGLNLLSHNRWVFAAALAFLALAVVGLEVLGQGQLGRRAWFLIPAGLVLLLGVWCAARARELPEPLATEMETALRHGQRPLEIADLAGLREVQARYVRDQVFGVLLCGLALGGWLLVWFGARGPWCRSLLGAALLGELLWFAHGRNPQGDPRLDYPRLPLLERLAEESPARALAVGCLPANLLMSHDLRDLRGYDSLDPRGVVELLELVRAPGSSFPRYARLQDYIPDFDASPSGELRLPPLIDMLGVRYLIFRGKPPPNLRPWLTAPDYWALENLRALPRVFVPGRVEAAPSRERLLARLASPSFDPRAVAYVEGPVGLPEHCRGTAAVVAEVPTEVVVRADLETPGLLVLADLWDEGWHAYRDGVAVPILKTNHALRGVVLPAGRSTLGFRYEPASVTWGLRLLATGAAGLVAWGLFAWWWARRRSALAAGVPRG